MGERKEMLDKANRIVVKVGSSTLTYSSGKLNLNQLEKLVRQLADLHNEGKEVVLVTSGAVAAGLGKLGIAEKPRTIPEKQAVAAVGQGLLMHMYEKFFSDYGIVVAQILLTREDFVDRRRYLNARNALHNLHQLGVIPIVNENDTVSVDEFKFGDNDTLSALVASLVEADLLVILSDIDGLYNGNPKDNPEAKLISLVEEISPSIEKMAGGAGSALGTGGMSTKLQAGKIATNSGSTMVIAQGQEPNVIRRILDGENLGTVFIPTRDHQLHQKKKWLAYSSTVLGKVYVDQGAEKALIEIGKSLLPSGVLKVEGTFDIGSTISIHNQEGKEFARGISNYSSQEIEQIKGQKSCEISNILGYKDYDEVVHRNNLVICV